MLTSAGRNPAGGRARFAQAVTSTTVSPMEARPRPRLDGRSFPAVDGDRHAAHTENDLLATSRLVLEVEGFRHKKHKAAGSCDGGPF